MSRGRPDLDCKVYVGDLPRDATDKELERAFNYYGPLRSVWVARNPPGFAFVEFEDSRDADDAIRGLDGTWVVLILCISVKTLLFFVKLVTVEMFFFLPNEIVLQNLCPVVLDK